MRIWSLHPKYLDGKGLVALWRETLLARKVLEGGTKGYKNHPQLNRFKQTGEPVAYLNCYLKVVYVESMDRGYKFDRSKIGKHFASAKLAVTDGQLNFERNHLLKKLKARDMDKYKELIEVETLEPHPLFKVVKGEIEAWEIIKIARD